MSAADKEALRQQILNLVGRYGEISTAPRPFTPGESAIPPSGKVIGAPELEQMVDAVLDGWLTAGRFNDLFEKRLAKYLGVKHLLTTNSGSSANLLAFTALTSPLLGERAIQPGDEVICVAAGFPTSVNPILQNGAVPVFVDIEIPTYNIDADALEAAVSEKSRAVMLAHTLGNPFNLSRVKALCEKYNLWLVEDCCDALGSRYNDHMVGGFGDIGTLSFYPAHHITMGEGGAVFSNDGRLRRILLSLRDWGRDCHCPPGHDNSCGRRYGWQLGELPAGYDHKYIYTHLGYNLKITDMQAACALAQLDRLEEFCAQRRSHFQYLYQGLEECTEWLTLPQATPGSDPSWFGFPISVNPEAPFERLELLRHLDAKRIGTRLLFAGNLVRQPYMQGQRYRISEGLQQTDRAMRDTFWIGLYPGLSHDMLDFTVATIKRFCQGERG